MMADATTQLTGIVGWPVAHSRSPRIHTHWLRSCGIDGAYLPLPVQPSDLADAISGLRALGFRGANVTIPHKQAVFALCDELDRSAREAGAVNTLSFSNGRLIGGNTDGAGFLQSLADAAVHPDAGPALILGAGGAARAIAAALRGAGASVTVTSRSVDAASALAYDLPGLHVAPWPALPALTRARLLINATAGGMTGTSALNYPLSATHPDLAVADIVYAPRQTMLLAEAQALGLRTVEGIGMLLHQAALSFQIWFGVTPPVDDAVRAVALDLLG